LHSGHEHGALRWICGQVLLGIINTLDEHRHAGRVGDSEAAGVGQRRWGQQGDRRGEHRRDQAGDDGGSSEGSSLTGGLGSAVGGFADGAGVIEVSRALWRPITVTVYSIPV
jgi:hypothetical protein